MTGAPLFEGLEISLFRGLCDFGDGKVADVLQELDDKSPRLVRVLWSVHIANEDTDQCLCERDGVGGGWKVTTAPDSLKYLGNSRRNSDSNSDSNSEFSD